ncbi:hypothetical protein QE357_004630 [Siphonobacter sp. BAB-5404]|nr:hypothetical protein [Siphonobacter sp. SORGH_AS_0500]
MRGEDAAAKSTHSINFYSSDWNIGTPFLTFRKIYKGK